MNLRYATFLSFAACCFVSCLDPPPLAPPAQQTCDMTSMDADMSTTPRMDMSQNMCVAQCTQGQTRCGSSCMNTQTDTMHCGACGVVCETGFVCDEGACVCPEGLERCDGTCVDTGADDPDHCGGCGVACPGVPCRDGACLCGAGKIVCGGACVEIVNSEDHCGECGQSCGIGCDEDTCVTIVDMGTSRRHTCVVLNSGDVYCWGINNHGETGQGTSGEATMLPKKAVAFDALNVVDVALGDHLTCVLTEKGEVHCLGLGDEGQLATQPNETNTNAIQVMLPQPARAISAGFQHVCALLEDRTIACWGRSAEGQVGTGVEHPTLIVSEPGAVLGLGDVVSLDLGFYHSCAIVEKERSLFCWGSKDGLGTMINTSRPGDSPTVKGVAQVSAGYRHTCYVDMEGKVFCAGTNVRGQLGTRATSQGAFVPVEGLPKPALQVEAGYESTCALLKDETVWCWGSNQLEQLGGGRHVTQDNVPRRVVGPRGSKILKLGDQAVCASTEDQISCWGGNGLYQLGVGGSAPVFSPVLVPLSKAWKNANPRDTQ